MADQPVSPTNDAVAPGATPVVAPVPPRRSPGHRGADVKDTVAEMTAKAHEISLEAGSKMAAAMKDVINAAAGITGFVLESARDLVQYMVRRGQMTQDEADKLIQQAEAAQGTRKAPGNAAEERPRAVAPAAEPAATRAPEPAAEHKAAARGGSHESAPKASSASKRSKPATSKAPKAAGKTTAAKPAAKGSVSRGAAAKAAARPAARKASSRSGSRKR